MMYRKFSLCLIYLLLLSSCSQTSVRSISTPIPSPPIMMMTTLQSFATPLGINEYLGEVSDGKLLFTIEETDNSCHNVVSAIEIKLIFTNLTNSEINLVNNFSVATNRHGAGGNIAPFLFTDKNEDVYSLADARIADYFPSPVNDRQTILAGQEFTVVVNYKFPKYFVESRTSETETLLTPSPGLYFLRFIYSEYERDIDTWYGFIGSNLVEICIIP